MNYEARVARLEQVLAPAMPRAVIVFGDADEDEAVANFREVNEWPDDAAHPVHVVHVRWVQMGVA